MSTGVTITDDQLVALALRAQAGDKEAAEAAMIALEPTCRKLCRPLRHRTTATVDMDDLLQVARMTAYRAILDYRPDTGVSVQACAGQMIKWRTYDALNREHARCVGSLEALHEGEDERRPVTVGDDGATVWQPANYEFDALLYRLPRGTPERDWVELEKRIAPRGFNTSLPSDDDFARMIREGLTNKEIAAACGTTVGAVDHRLTELRRQTGGFERQRMAARLPEPEELIRLIELGATRRQLMERYDVTVSVLTQHLMGLRKAGWAIPAVAREWSLNPAMPDVATVVDLVEQGYSLGDMAREYGISPRAVQRHIEALRKSGVSMPAVRHGNARKQPGGGKGGLATGDGAIATRKPLPGQGSVRAG